MHHFEVAEFSVLPIHDNSARAMYHYIATGTTVDDTFYRDLEYYSKNKFEDTQQFKI